MLQQLLQMSGQLRRAIGVAQLDDDERDLGGFLQQTLRDAQVDEPALLVKHVVTGAENSAYFEAARLTSGSHDRDRVTDLHVHLLREQRAKEQSRWLLTKVAEIARDHMPAQIRGL